VIHLPKTVTAMLASVRYIFDPQFAAGGVAVGIASTAATAEARLAGVSASAWVAPGYLLGAVLVSMTFEAGSCYLGKTHEQRREHVWERVWIAKLFILMLVVVAMLLDGAFYFASDLIPAAAGFHSVIRGIMPITMSSLFWFLLAECARVVNNIRHYEGANSSIPPIVLWFISQFRKEDERRYPGVDGPPPRRWTDDLTAEQVAAMLDEYKRNGGAVPPAVARPAQPPVSS
jgi:hypothetical protein